VEVWLIAAIMVIVSIWTILWKGWALWLSARRGEKWWFIALLVINTVGILEILYIFFVAKRTDSK
jgi:methionyl-tRNA synthetase